MAMPSPSCSCSHWWHAPVYVAVTIALVIAAISSSSSSSSSSTSSGSSSSPDLLFPPPGVVSDAALALHRAGYHLTAALLEVAPGVLLPPGRPATLFAPPDPALSNLSLPDAARLFSLHAVPLRLPLSALLRIPSGACIPTLLHGTHLRVASSDGSLTINSIPVSQPDIFLGGPHVVHGSSAAFPRLQGAECRAEAGAGAVVPWAGLAGALGARGYVEFSVWLGAVLDEVARAAQGLDGVTVFAPLDGGLEHAALPAGALARAVGRQVAVGRFGYAELSGMKAGRELRTLAEGVGLRITASGDAGVVALDGVAIIEPDALASEAVVVHGVSNAFGVAPLVR